MDLKLEAAEKINLALQRALQFLSIVKLARIES
jgi:hypothetical protein